MTGAVTFRNTDGGDLLRLVTSTRQDHGLHDPSWREVEEFIGLWPFREVSRRLGPLCAAAERAARAWRAQAVWGDALVLVRLYLWQTSELPAALRARLSDLLLADLAVRCRIWAMPPTGLPIHPSRLRSHLETHRA